MAEFNPSSQDLKSRKKAGIKKNKTLANKIVLTPLVYLGFLFITFFMFTKAMSQPNSMKLKMPIDNQNSSTNIGQSGVLTLLLGENNRIYYYNGALKKDFSNVGLSNFKDIKKLILNKKNETNPDNLFIRIIPGIASNYKNIVDLLEDFSIDGIVRYAVINLNKVDSRNQTIISNLDSLSKKES